MGRKENGRSNLRSALVVFLSAMALVIVPAAVLAQAPGAPKYLIRWNLDSGPGDTLSIRAEKTRELVQADPELKDLLKIELYYSNSLLKAPDAVEALLRGDIQMCFVGTWYLEKLAPNIIVLEFPFLLKGLDNVNKFFDSFEAEDWIYKALTGKGLKWLAGSPVGTYSLLTKEPVRQVGDLKNMKIRTAGNGAHTVSSLGAVPISLPAGNIYIALQRGTIQGADISPISILDRRLYEVGKYFLNAPIHFTSDFALANKKWWDSLPEKVRVKLESYVKEGNQVKRQAAKLKEQQALTQTMPANGVKVYVPTAEEMRKWKETSLPAWEVLIKKVANAEIIKKIEQMQE